ncbi:MAG: CDP-diacylglycerol--glycerol-3-phosphate 3-phosphatidyltransferase [Verrucomicrobiales bacterium]|nr:CDP-diacylglycerol--glycerol-3-phosphate 3-phosphatidyltransferase [Verrucomicrobiales bacterium]|tara:strand:+ start:69954 stop:70625 length:672 start_codon:yes stop_codon:yes gene_type:complete
MNLPNKITTSRFFITVAFVVVLLFEWQWATTAACLLFLIGGLSDIADGEIARRRNLKTDFGILMDPLADKIMVCAGFIVLVGMSASTHPYISEQPNIPHVPRWLEVPGQDFLMPAWMVIIIVARELAITGLRLLAASKNVVLPAETIGKRKTNLQVVSVISVLVCVSYPHWGDWGQRLFSPEISGLPWSIWFTLLVTWGAVVLTGVSGVHYLWRNRDLYLKDM